jgi:hypothetical protein
MTEQTAGEKPAATDIDVMPLVGILANVKTQRLAGLLYVFDMKDLGDQVATVDIRQLCLKLLQSGLAAPDAYSQGEYAVMTLAVLKGAKMEGADIKAMLGRARAFASAHDLMEKMKGAL